MALSAALLKATKQAQNKYSRSTGSRIKPKEGKNVYRLLAPAKADWLGPAGEFWKELGVHWLKAEKNGKPLAVVGACDIVYGQPSVINTAIDLAINSAMDEETKKLYEEWRAKTSILVNVIDRSNTSGDPDILELTPTTWAKVLEILTQHAEEAVDITDLNDGIDIVITKSGKGLQTEYTVLPKPGKSDPVKPDVLNRVHDLAAHIEKEFFRGEENKALSIIGQISGVKIPGQLINGGANLALAAAKAAVSTTPTPALASAAASVDEEEAALEALEKAEPVKAPVAAPAVDVDDEEAQLMAQLEAKRKAKAAAAAAAEAAAKAPPAVDPADVLSASDVDDVLAELANI